MRIRKTKILTLSLLLVLELNSLLPHSAFAQTTADTIPAPSVATQTSGTLPTASFPTLLSTNPTPLAIDTNSQPVQSSAFASTSPIVQKLSRKFYRSDEGISFSIANPQQDSFSVSLYDAKDKKADVTVTQVDNNNAITYAIAPRNQFRPGKYKLVVTDADGKRSEQDFSWGVLALNTDRSIYLPGQKADLAMAVLDEGGNMVCDAKLVLEITNQKQGISETLSTSNGKITSNPQCQSHNFSLLADYAAEYQVSAAGTYTLNLTAQTKNGSYSISDMLIVQDSVPFDVQRISSTRIYPPNNYPVQLNITANQDFEGKITETVPDSFTVTASDTANSYNTMQTIYMNRKTDPATQLSNMLTNAAQASSLSNQVLGASTSALLLPFSGSFPITEGFGAEQTDPDLRLLYEHYGLAGHDGVDFGLPMNTPVRAVDNGVVLRAGPGDYGITVVIQHSWGKSYYGHLSQVLVSIGNAVTKGTQIGISGNTGEATGPHLHFGMKPESADTQNGYAGKIDPLPYFNLLPSAQIADGPALVSGDTTVLGASTSATLQSNQVTPPQTITDTFQQATNSAFINHVASQVLNTPTTANYNKIKIITWNVSLKKDQKISLGYTFKAPSISPQFYLLGPLRFFDNSATGSGKPIFQETRQWQIAADAIGTGWYDYQWQYRKQITIQHGQVSTSDQTNFPVLVSLASDGDLQANANGNDILFTDSTGQTKLNHEIEKYNSSTGELDAWVKVPTLSSSVDTILYMYYGNAAAANQENATGVWDSNYLAVYHLGQTPTASIVDSTGHANGATNNMVSGDQTTGQVDGALSFNGSNKFVDVGTGGTVKGVTQYTVSAWFNVNAFTAANKMQLYSECTGVGTTRVNFGLTQANPGQITLNGRDADGNGLTTFITNSTTLSTSTWYYASAVYDSTSTTNNMHLMLNGTDQTASVTRSAITNTTPSGATEIGAHCAQPSTPTEGFNGKIDELRISNIARSAAWNTTEYNNLSSPSSFFTLSGVETKLYAPTLDLLMRGGKWFGKLNGSGVSTIQPYAF